MIIYWNEGKKIYERYSIFTFFYSPVDVNTIFNTRIQPFAPPDKRRIMRVYPKKQILNNRAFEL